MHFIYKGETSVEFKFTRELSWRQRSIRKCPIPKSSRPFSERVTTSSTTRVRKSASPSRSRKVSLKHAFLIFLLFAAPEERKWLWAFPQIEGVPPSPRGGHSATLTGASLVIFGVSLRTLVGKLATRDIISREKRKASHT